MSLHQLEKSYDHERHMLVEDILKGNASRSLMEWARNTPNWMTILRSNDVAMFPDELQHFKKVNAVIIEETYQEFLQDEDDIVDPDAWRQTMYMIAEIGYDKFNRLLEVIGVNCPHFMMNEANALINNPNAFDDELEAIL